MLRKNLVFVSVLVIALTLSGCQFISKPTLDRIVVSADAETIKQGESVELEVKGFDKKNKEMKVSKPAWSAEPDNLGELDVNGAKAVFTAGETAEGKVTITVTSGDLSDSIEITIIKETTSVDKSDLEDAIQAATQLKQSTEVGTEPGQAPQEAHDALQAAIDSAQAVLDNEDATQAEVDSATQALLQAIAAFEEAIVPDEEPGQVDKTALAAAIAEAEDLLASTDVGINKGQAPVHAHHALETAVNNAAAVEEDDDATQEDVDDAVTALEQAIAAFNAAIVTTDDPVKAHMFVVDGNISHFVTQANRGTIEANTDPQYIKTGGESILCNAIGQPFYVRVTDTHPNWINDWREYDHLAAWFWVESTASLNNNTAIQIGYPMNTARITLARAEFKDGWNEIVVSLRDDLELTDEQLANMAGLFEFFIRYDQEPSSESPAPPVYFDAIRLLKLEETGPVDKSDLETAIQNATNLKGSTPVGTDPGQAPQTAHDALQQA
ncbi:MAG: FIVAR domain-containing protein, partial [Limnochordia bacterium]